MFINFIEVISSLLVVLLYISLKYRSFLFSWKVKDFFSQTSRNTVANVTKQVSIMSLFRNYKVLANIHRSGHIRLQTILHFTWPQCRPPASVHATVGWRKYHAMHLTSSVIVVFPKQVCSYGREVLCRFFFIFIFLPCLTVKYTCIYFLMNCVVFITKQTFFYSPKNK